MSTKLASLIEKVTTEHKGLSDLFLIPGNKTSVRVDGKISPVNDSVLSGDDVKAMALEITSQARLDRIYEEGSIDVSIPVSDELSARAGIALTRGDVSVVIRFLNSTIYSLERVSLPPVVKDIISSPNGLVIVSGPTGSGKTTSLYAMVDWLNTEKEMHICTVENPVALTLKSKKSLIQQREVGKDVSSFVDGISAALHQDLDALVIGEIKDLDTLVASLTAAETGHLVMIQLHASRPWEAIERIIEACPEASQPSIRRRLAEMLRGVICQRLVRNASGKGRTAVYDVFMPDENTRKGIVAGGGPETYRGSADSIAMEDEIAKLEKAGTISAEEAEKALGWIST